MSDELIFDAYRTDIKSGVTLVEASAGTGKTFTIAMLVLRAVVELGIGIEQVLVVTFTIAATDELRERVRQRLSRARHYLKNSGKDERPVEDGDFHEWLKTIKNHELAVQRLDLALADIDRAAIHTIHGFCQLTLKELALESGRLFDLELTGDVSLIRKQVTQDYWRERIYRLDKRYCNLVISSFKSPEQLYQSIAGAENILSRLLPEPIGFSETCRAFDRALDGLQQWWEGKSRKLKKVVMNAAASGFFTAKNAEFISTSLARIDACFKKNHGPVPADLAWLEHDALIGLLHGNKLRGDEKKNQFIAGWPLPGEKCTAYLAAAENFLLAVRLELAAALRSGLTRRMRDQGTMSFDDLIVGLADAVAGEQGEELCRLVRKRYKIALIDEFQDTDSAQWQIFSTLFATKDHYLYLIGDPKQAIYRFRGADIFSYFSAREKADYRLTLKRNYRSNPGLVTAVNSLFERYQTGGVNYQPVLPARSSEDGRLVEKSREMPCLVYCQVDRKETDSPAWNSGDSGDLIRAWVVSETVSLISQKSPVRVESVDSGGNSRQRKIVPADIAILVRSHREAEAYQACFRIIGIPAVITSKTSVFATAECGSLLLVLQAIAAPGSERALKTAMSCDWFGLSGDDHFRISSNADDFNRWHERFQDYSEIWQKAGFLPMISRFLENEQVEIKLGRGIGAERRISNIHHLVELVQEQERKAHHTMSRTVQWLQEMANGKQYLDEVELRLESDADSLRIITMHSAKGLEFPVVFCPSLLNPAYHRKNIQLVHSHLDNGTRICDLGSVDFEKSKSSSLLEEQHENMRLAYVAVTRAQLRCYIIWAHITERYDRPSSLHSPLGQLLFPFAAAGFEEQKKEIERRGGEPGCSYCLIENRLIETAYQAGVESAPVVLKSKKATGRILTTSRTRTSFSGLAMLSHDENQDQLPGAFDESQRTSLMTDPDVVQHVSDTSRLPGGVRFGNIVHDALEQLKFSELAAGRGDRRQLAAISRRHNLLVDNDALERLLRTSVMSPLTADNADAFTLAELDEDRLVKEMAFTLHLQKSSTAVINDLLIDDPCVSSLSVRSIEGYLTGYVDLVCEAHGKYFVIDYKTNHLGDSPLSYETQSLQWAMRSHNYGLQYWLYTLVVNRYLQRWLPQYRYRDHFGGVYYLFVRGMRPEKPGMGVFFTKPDENLVQKLDKCFGGL